VNGTACPTGCCCLSSSNQIVSREQDWG